MLESACWAPYTVMNRVFALSMAMSRRAITPSAGALAPALRGLDRRVRKRHLLEFAQGLFDLQIGVGQGRPSPSACRFTSLKWFTMAFDPTTGKTPRP